MDFLLLALGLAILAYQVRIYRQLKELDRRNRMLLQRSTARQGGVRGIQIASHASPHIDARARTTKRDTDDLPRTGRLGKLQPRRGGVDDGIRDDSGLQEQP